MSGKKLCGPGAAAAALATVRRRKDIVSFFARWQLYTVSFFAFSSAAHSSTPTSSPAPCCSHLPCRAALNFSFAVDRAILLASCIVNCSWTVIFSGTTRSTDPGREWPPLTRAFRVRNAITFCHLRAIIYAFLLMPQKSEDHKCMCS